jgi:hypothetical protein
MSVTTVEQVSVRHYFVDEAGDPNLFSKKGRVIVGTPGCSRFLILGLLEVADPVDLRAEMDALRARLLVDPRFRHAPSVQPEQRKTALTFHAKDDLPGVREEVFGLLQRHALRFYAVIRDKAALLERIRQQSRRDPSHRYDPNDAYDFCVLQLFERLLHKHDVCHVYFAQRGKPGRTAALEAAVQSVLDRSVTRWGTEHTTELRVTALSPPRDAALQATDYFLWALQRLYERQEERYVQMLWPAFRRVRDIDDTREKAYGRYYSEKRPLSLAALKGRPGI